MKTFRKGSIISFFDLRLFLFPTSKEIFLFGCLGIFLKCNQGGWDCDVGILHSYGF